MPRFLILILILISIAPATRGGDLLVDAHYANSVTVTNRRVALKLQQPGAVVAGPWLVAGDYVVQYTDTNGITVFSNVLAGGYSLTIYGSPERSFAFGMPDTNGTVSAAALIGNTNTTPVYYTASQVDLLLAALEVGGLAFVPQLGSANLTNWSTLTTNVLGSLVGSSPNALTNGDTRAIGLASTLSVTSTVIANGNAVVSGVIYGNAAGVTNLPPKGFASTNTGTAGQVFKKIDANTGYWADDDGSGGGLTQGQVSAAISSGTNTFNGAGLITNAQLATMAVNVTNQPVYDVIQFGANPNDDVADNVAIQAAIDAASTNQWGGVVYFPQGTNYLLGAMNLKSGSVSEGHPNLVNILSNNITIRGAGMNRSRVTLQATNYTGQVFNGWGGGNTSPFIMGPSNLVFEDIWLDGGMSNQTYCADFTQFYNSQNSTLRRVRISYTREDAIDFHNDLRVYDCEFFNIGNGLGSGGSTYSSIYRNCYMTNLAIMNVDGGEGIGVSGGYLYLENCIAHNPGKIGVRNGTFISENSLFYFTDTAQTTNFFNENSQSMPSAVRGIPGWTSPAVLSASITPAVNTDAVVTAAAINFNSFVLAYTHNRR